MDRAVPCITDARRLSRDHTPDSGNPDRMSWGACERAVFGSLAGCGSRQTDRRPLRLYRELAGRGDRTNPVDADGDADPRPGS